MVEKSDMAPFVSRYNNGYGISHNRSTKQHIPNKAADEPKVAVTWFLRSDEQHSPTHPYPLTLTASIMLQHLPLITRCVEFTPLAYTPLPSITVCREFTIARECSLSPPPVDRGSPPLLEASDASNDLMHSDDDNISGGALDEEGVDRLETRKSFKNQKVEEIQAICDAAVNDHSILRVYENAWPVCDILKLRLKYTSEKARWQRGKRMQQKLARVSYKSTPPEEST
ncbi:hypothetical protein EDD18DRAFT_1112439 [Armillaria luteobubalina]|uniref:Uncharacterized protein n=1 Tax=Armillaria luteobubalina TaxID=153913 RepID=A0AA39UBA0_9AGAR|nr:hypothetical protein EDD18DRAFT_1112439 [Armillaria luteobubalina]